MNLNPRTNLRQFPTPAAKLSNEAIDDDPATKLELIRISQLTGVIYSISLQPFFKAQGFTLSQLAAAALSLATQHMSGVSEAAVASVAEGYAQE
jgi:hypothetical protein